MKWYVVKLQCFNYNNALSHAVRKSIWPEIVVNNAIAITCTYFHVLSRVHAYHKLKWF